jgi:apolipoprotein D and lipocalin family protein
MRAVTLLLLSACGLLNTGCLSSLFYPELKVVEGVDVKRYMGTWYEIARYPNFFQDAACDHATAQYTLNDDGTVKVVNRCGPTGTEQSIEGTARVVDANTNAKLKVRFFGPFEGDYWIIDLDPDYEWAVVGEPSRRFLWILSRTPTMDATVYDDILSRLPGKNYDPTRLIVTSQAAGE